MKIKLTLLSLSAAALLATSCGDADMEKDWPILKLE